MSCREEMPGEGSKDKKKVVKKNRLQQAGISIAVIVWAIYASVSISRLWTKDAPKPEKAAKRVWEQMVGNDGKFWRGSPDASGYADMDGVECRTYYHYSYDRQGRRQKTEYYRKHDYYEDVWCLSDEITYAYDGQDRMVSATGLSSENVYEYGSEGYSRIYRYYHSGDKRDTYVYDGQDNLISSRVTTRYSAGYEMETTFSYDERNRKIQETTKIGKNPAYVSLTIDYDSEAHTGLSKSYNSKGELQCITLSRYDEEWRELGNIWCDVSTLPKNVSPEDWMDYHTVGCWAYYQDGLLMEELTNTKGGKYWNSGWYEAYDYDEDGNCILNITVFGEGEIYLKRYEFDKKGNMTDEYYYSCNDVKNWEVSLTDGGSIVIDNDGEDREPFSIIRRAPDGSILNQFVYGDDEIMQYTPTDQVCWYTKPRDFSTEQSPGTKPGDIPSKPGDEPTNPGGEPTNPGDGPTKPGGEPFKPEDTPPAIYYTVQPGDCLWLIGEHFWGDGRLWKRIYQENRDAIGDDPRLIFPGMELYLDGSWNVRED